MDHAKNKFSAFFTSGNVGRIAGNESLIDGSGRRDKIFSFPFSPFDGGKVEGKEGNIFQALKIFF
ncbi:MAG: hypothetical protein ACM3SY_04975 [Candidatus Omnitrophota bacterium]